MALLSMVGTFIWKVLERMVGNMFSISEVIIKAPEGNLKAGLVVRNKAVHEVIFATDEAWQQSATKGLQELSAKVTEELKKNQ